VTYVRNSYGNQSLKQDRECTYNVTMRRVRVTTVAMKNKYVCSLSKPLCTEQALYYIVICGLLGSTILLHIISLTAQFSGKQG